MIRFYFGTDQGRTSQVALNEIDHTNLVKIDLFKDSFQMVIDELSSFSLFDENKNMIVFNCDFISSLKTKNISKNDEEKLLLLLENISSDFNVSFVNNTKLSKNEFIEKLKKLSVKIIEINKLNEDEYYSLFSRIAKENNKEVNKEMFNEFFKRGNDDYLSFINEANKLFTYPDKITIDVIKKLITLKIEDNIFQLCNLILSRKKDEAIKAYRDLRFLNNDAISILLIMTSQFRFIYLVKYLNNKKYSNDEIANELTTKEKKVNPGRIYYVLKDCTYYDYNMILSLLFELAKIEENIKLNQDNADYLLEFFILNS